MKKFAITLPILFLLVASAQAHVSVRPDKVGVGAFQTFTVSVPSEKDLATTQLRLELPMGLESFTPTVKPGWKIDVKTHVMDGTTHPYEITWSGSAIPGHMRDEFTFSAKVPATAQAINWKAYQTYSDGGVVSWEMDPKSEPFKDAEGKPDFSKAGPYSTTQIVNDLSATATAAPVAAESKTPLVVSSIAIVIALISIVVSLMKRP